MTKFLIPLAERTKYLALFTSQGTFYNFKWVGHKILFFTSFHFFFSYETAISIRSMLHEVTWTYIVVDEGHRLKNRNCRLGQELRRIPSKHRMLLTGTPLQNDMEELWSLLNYLQPDLFNHWELFAVSKLEIDF